VAEVETIDFLCLVQILGGGWNDVYRGTLCSFSRLSAPISGVYAIARQYI